MKIRPFRNISRPATAIAPTITTLLCGLILTAGVMAAEPEPSEKPAAPIQITADRLISDSNNNNAEFIGNVKVVQNQTTITADRLRLIYPENGRGPKDGPGQTEMSADSIDTIEAFGHVRIEFDNRVAVGEKAVYTTAERKLILTGPGARLTQGPDVVEGSSITFYRDSGRIEMVGEVKATIRSDQRGLN